MPNFARYHLFSPIYTSVQYAIVDHEFNREEMPHSSDFYRCSGASVTPEFSLEWINVVNVARRRAVAICRPQRFPPFQHVLIKRCEANSNYHWLHPINSKD